MAKNELQVSITEELFEDAPYTQLLVFAVQDDIVLAKAMERGTTTSDILMDLSDAKKFVQTSKHLELPEKERKRRVRFYEQVAKKVYRGIE
jgi:uncharacterized protein YlxW (UPF0749 family)